jgi:hypothetical protein
MASFTLSGSSAQASSSTLRRSSSRLFRRNYPQLIPSGGENVALSRENDHKFESLLRNSRYSAIDGRWPQSDR